jgi:signal peptidase II
VHALQTERRTALRLRRKYPIWGSVLLVAALVWATDFVSKNWAINYLDGREPRKLIGSFLQLTFTRNSGAAFSIGTDRTILLVAFAVLVVGVIGYWTPRITSRKWGVVLGLVLGGTLGNLTDRILRATAGTGTMKGQVIDWIQLPHWPVFNLADSSIVVAAVIASYLSLRNIAPIEKKVSGRDSDGA